MVVALAVIRVMFPYDLIRCPDWRVPLECGWPVSDDASTGCHATALLVVSARRVCHRWLLPRRPKVRPAGEAGIHEAGGTHLIIWGLLDRDGHERPPTLAPQI